MAVTVTTTVNGRARVTVGEVKVFPDRGGHTDPQQLASIGIVDDEAGRGDRLEAHDMPKDAQHYPLTFTQQWANLILPKGALVPAVGWADELVVHL